MPKLRRVRKRQKYQHNVNRKRLRNKLRKVPDIKCSEIKEAWDSNKSTRKNLEQMGLAYDANEVLKIPNIKKEMINNAKKTISRNHNENIQQIQFKKIPQKIQVAMELEADAKAPRERHFRLPKGQVQFLTYLMDKYGDDYKAMSRDKKNYDQLTWRQIRSKVNVFKGIPEQYAQYLVQKGEIILDDPTTLEETKKKLAEENIKKFCTPKNNQKKKKKKFSVSQWIEENLNDKNNELSEFDTTKTLVATLESNSSELKTTKKLKLFPDEENDGRNVKNKKVTKEIKNSLKTKTITLSSSDSDNSEDEFDDNDDGLEFTNLSDLSDEDMSDNDISLDEQFDTNSDDDSDEK